MVQNVEPSADERITGRPEIDHLRRVIKLTRKPRLDRVLVGRGDIHEMIDLQRADMVRHRFPVEFRDSLRREKADRQNDEYGGGPGQTGKRRAQRKMLPPW